MSEYSRPIPTQRGGIITAVLLACGLFWAASARGQQAVTSTLVAPNPPPDFGTVEYDPTNPANMGINREQYGYCQVCSPQPYTQVAGCPNPVGTQTECQAYCHVVDGTPLTYGDDPPHSGNHNPEPERGIGEHTTPVGRGHYVHSQEHGAIILLYNCPDGCSGDLQTYRDAVAKNPCQPVIITADSDLKSRFAMVSWTWRARGDKMFDPATVDCFIKQHAAHGRECPPNGVCPAFIFSNSQCAKNPATQP